MIKGALDVVIPVRNGEKTIVASVKSVVKQTRPPRRIILVDDGSTDRTVELALAHDRGLIDVVRTPPTGVSHARNTGILSSDAEYVALLDCDDLWRHDKLQLQMDLAARRPDAVAIGCSSVEVEPNCQFIIGTFKRMRSGTAMPKPVIWNSAFYKGWSSSVLVRRSAWQDAGGFDEGLIYGEDADFIMRLARRGPIAACEEVLAFIVSNPSSVTRRRVSGAGILDDIFAKFRFYEKWVQQESQGHGHAAGHAATAILKAVAANPGLASQLTQLRLRMKTEAPELAKTFAGSDLRLFVSVCLNVLRRGDRVAYFLARRLGRLLPPWMIGNASDMDKTLLADAAFLFPAGNATDAYDDRAKEKPL